jgi:hypothetical protein
MEEILKAFESSDAVVLTRAFIRILMEPGNEFDRDEIRRHLLAQTRKGLGGNLSQAVSIAEKACSFLSDNNIKFEISHLLFRRFFPIAESRGDWRLAKHIALVAYENYPENALDKSVARRKMNEVIPMVDNGKTFDPPSSEKNTLAAVYRKLKRIEASRNGDISI